MGNLIGNMCKCIVNNEINIEKEREEEEYKKKIETTLTSLDSKIEKNRRETKEDIKDVKQDLKDVKGDLKDGIKDLKDDMKFYYGGDRSKSRN